MQEHRYLYATFTIQSKGMKNTFKHKVWWFGIIAFDNSVVQDLENIVIDAEMGLMLLVF